MKDLREAKRLVKPASMRVDRLITEAEAKLEGAKPAPSKVSREEIVWFVSDWFIKEEARNAEWSERTLPRLSEPEKAGMLGSLIIDNASLNGASAYGADDGSGQG